MEKAARAYIVEVMGIARGSAVTAARIAGINRTHFFKMLRRYRVKLDRWPDTRVNHGNEDYKALQ
jgi:transcriptional regulator of acetoin/glycerol metabolism